MYRSLSVLLVSVFLASPSFADSTRTLVMGGKDFSESRILAEIMTQWIEAKTDIKVVRKYNLSSTLAFQALRAKSIDIYPEYSGTIWGAQLKRTKYPNNSLHAYFVAKREALKKFGFALLPIFGFNNTYAMAMREDHAKRLNIQSISDLKAHKDTLRLGANFTFFKREDSYPRLVKTYGFKFKQSRGMDHNLTYAALHEKKIDVMEAWTTDGKIQRYKLRLLKDDKMCFLPYHAAPLTRLDVLRKFPKLERLLTQLSFRINHSTMQALNAQAEKGIPLKTIAVGFLQKQKLIGGEVVNINSKTPKPTFLSYISTNRSKMLRLLSQHVFLTLWAIILAILVAVPLGIAMTRWSFLGTPVLSIVSGIQTIPSLALLALLIPIPFLGLGTRSAIFALFLYALLPIVRNTFVGIKGVDSSLLEAAKGMGMHPRQILWMIELPLATQMIMAGIRTAAVIGVGYATLASFVGAGGLGELILVGMQLNRTHILLAGALPATGLALGLDWLLGVVERKLTPKGLEGSSS